MNTYTYIVVDDDFFKPTNHQKRSKQIVIPRSIFVKIMKKEGMQNFSEVIKIIETALDGDRTKAIAYANLLQNKVSEKQANMIIERITGEYKTKPVVRF